MAFKKRWFRNLSEDRNGEGEDKTGNQKTCPKCGSTNVGRCYEDCQPTDEYQCLDCSFIW